MLSLKEFVLESLETKSEKKWAKDIIKKNWNRNKYKELFKLYNSGKYHLDKSGLRIYTPLYKSNIPDPNKEVIDALESEGYFITDYHAGKVKNKNGREQDLLLALNNIKRPDLKDIYQKDPYHKAVTEANKAKTYSVVISANPVDIVSMSIHRKWSEYSCMNLEKHNGEYANQYIPMDIKQGSLIAYLIRSEDKYIKDPLARVNIRPYASETESDIILYPATKIYRDDRDPESSKNYEQFGKIVAEWVDDTHEKQKLEGIFNIESSIYTGETHETIKIGTKSFKEYLQKNIQKIKDDPEFINELKPRDQINIFKYYDGLKYLKYIKNPSHEVQMAIVSNNGNDIKYLFDLGIKPSDRILFAALEQNIDSIKYLDENGIIDEDFLLKFVSRNLQYIDKIIKYIKKDYIKLIKYIISVDSKAIETFMNTGFNLTEDDIIDSIDENPSNIKYIKDPSEKVQLMSVSKNPNMIQYILKNNIKPSDDVLITAISKKPSILEYILKNRIKPSEEVQIAAIKEDNNSFSILLNYGIKPSEEVQKIALEKNPYDIMTMYSSGIKPSENVQIALVSSHPFYIEYIERYSKASEKVQLAAVKKDPNAIKVIKDKSPAVIELAKSKGVKI